MVSSEAAPLAKTGGLADVVGALPAALREVGDEVAVVIPRYGSIDLETARRVYDGLPCTSGPTATTSPSIRPPPDSLSIWWIARRSLTARVSTANRAWTTRITTSASPFSPAPPWPSRALFRADILHCHDWQAGLVPAYCAAPSPPTPLFWA